MRGLAGLLERDTEERGAWNDGASNWFSPGGKFGTQAVTQWTAFNLSAVWACETLIADAIATLPVDVFRNRNGQREPATRPAWVDSPNPENNRIDYETQRILSLLGWGNAYTLLVRENGSTDPSVPVVERWILNPGNTTVDRLVGDNEMSVLTYWHRGVQVPNTCIQHVRGYVLPGYYLGMSVITNARTGLQMTNAAEAAGANLYEQGMLQSGVLEVPQMPAEVSKDVTDRLRDQLMERHAGAGNAGKPMILTGGSKWAPTMMTLSDAQYLETRKFQINEICRWFRVPPHKIADIIAHASQGGGMGIEQQAGEFAQDTLLPWVSRLEMADSQLTPRGNYVKYNMNAYVRADLAARSAAYTAGRLGGWMSVDDVRALEDLPPLPDGKGQIYLQPANYIEAGTNPTVSVSGSVAPAEPAPLPAPPPGG